MAEKKFQSGDLVQLKSGGVPMTVEISKDSQDGTDVIVHCAWFVGDTSKKESFYQDALKDYVQDTSLGTFFV